MTEMTSVAQDFANAIQLDHLNDEQLKIVEDIFKDFK
jgi:hypothetical protein